MEAEEETPRLIQIDAVADTRSFDPGAMVRSSVGWGARNRMGTKMAYLLRSMAIVGVIALNSPVYGTKSEPDALIVDAKAAIAILAKIDPKAALQGAASIREAAEVLAGLEPETRARVLALAASAANRSSETSPRHR